MKIKIEIYLPRWLSRVILVGGPMAIIAIGAWVRADVPNTFKAGDALSAQKMMDNFAAIATPPGAIMAFGGPVVPSGWLLCDGSVVGRSTYSQLFTAIGTVHGSGDGASTFNLPDYRGRFLRGVDGGSGRDADSALRSAAGEGGNSGDKVGSLQSSATGLPRTGYSLSSAGMHNHSGFTGTESMVGGVGTSEFVFYNVAPTGTYFGFNPGAGYYFARTGDNGLGHVHSVPSDGTHVHSMTGGDSETRPVNVYVQYIIKT
jgi:microcystin-dependent protein